MKEHQTLDSHNAAAEMRRGNALDLAARTAGERKRCVVFSVVHVCLCVRNKIIPRRVCIRVSPRGRRGWRSLHKPSVGYMLGDLYAHERGGPRHDWCVRRVGFVCYV